MHTAKLSEKHQIVIPSDVRKKLGLRAGATVSIQPIDDRRAIILKRPSDITSLLEGRGKELWKALGGGARYIKAERASWKK